MIYKNQVLKIAIYSRALVFITQYIFNHLIEDHQPDVFRYATEEKKSLCDKVVQHFLGGFLRWDAQYYMHIAKNGYTYENSIAFPPLYPVTVRLIAIFLQNFITCVNFDSLLLLIFFIFNSIIFIKAATTLYELSEILLYPSIAYKSAVLFSFNPASVFFSAPYTETLFSYLTFKSILNCLQFYRKYSDKATVANINDLFFILPISLSTCTRSNGVLNTGFFIYMLICLFIDNFPKNHIMQFIFIIKYLLLMFMYILLSLLPFLLYQQFCFDTFCKDFNVVLPEYVKNYGNEQGFVLPGEHSKHNQSWCAKEIPVAYSYVQEHYWNVGFLRYYEFKQIPNFVLATPILALVICNCLLYLKRNCSRNVLHLFSFKRLYEKSKNFNILYETTLFVFVIHAFTFSLFCLFFVHIQVSTRMLCSSTPFVYWISAFHLQNTNFKNDVLKSFFFGKFSSNLEKFIKLYFMSYFFIGTILFCNYLPFT